VGDGSADVAAGGFGDGAGVGEQVGKSGTLDGGAALTPPLRSALLRNNPDIAV
jgi:hypothetical protein